MTQRTRSSRWALTPVFAAVLCGPVACGGSGSDSEGGGEGGEDDDFWDGCFVAGTPIDTPGGETAIEQLEVGDPVLAFDEAADATVVSWVDATFEHAETEVGDLSVADGRVITLTAHHPVFDADRELYVPASKVGRVRDASGELLLASSYRAATRKARVYNISVSTHQNYFASGVLVHNKTVEPPSPCGYDPCPPEPGDCELDTGFSGDDICRLPALDGYQLHLGPDDYDDPAALAPFIMVPGEERAVCTLLEPPADERDVSSLSIFTRGDDLTLTRLFRVSEQVASDPLPHPCSFEGARLVTASWGQRHVSPSASERHGFAALSGASLMIEHRTGNATDRPELTEVWINATPTDVPIDLLDSFQFGALDVSVPPSGTSTASATCQFADVAQIHDVSASLHIATTDAQLSIGDVARERWFNESPSVNVLDLPVLAGEPIAVTCGFFNDRDAALFLGPLISSDVSCELFGLAEAPVPELAGCR